MSKTGVEKLMEDLEKDKLTPPERRQVLAKCMQVAAQESKIVHGSIIALTDGDNDKGHIHLDGVQRESPESSSDCWPTLSAL